MKRRHIEAARYHARAGLLGQFSPTSFSRGVEVLDSVTLPCLPDCRDLIATIDSMQNQQTKREIPELVLREVHRLRVLGRTPDDIATLLGMNPADVVLLIYGSDDAGNG